MRGSSLAPRYLTTRRLMSVLWVSFTLAYAAFFYLFNDAREIAEASLDGYLEVILLGVPTVVMLAGSVWLGETDADRELHPRLLAWTVGMAALFVLAMHTALFVVETGFDFGERWLVLLMSTGFGASSGTVMGIMDIRSQQRERQRNRSLEEARRHERKRSQLEHLNHYLRHEVLNEAQKINGFATVLSERADISGDDADYLDTIRHSSEEIAVFVQSIRTVLDASDHDPDLEPRDVVEVLETEAEKIGQTRSEVSIDVRGEDSARVLAGDLLSRVFRNLIENAIEHNRGRVSVDIAVAVEGEWVEVSICDDGSGIPPGARETLFEAPESGDHGYGLFLTRNLLRVYGGQIELAETGPEGTTFVVRLLAARRHRPRPRPVATVS